jgi:hypothetical protein
MGPPSENSRPYWFYISGFNFAIVAGLQVMVFGRLLGRKRGMLAAWAGIAFYTVLPGFF